MNPFASLSTPRTQFEVAPGNFLRVRQPITLVRLQAAATTILTTGSEDFEIAQLVVANMINSAEALTLHLFATGGTAGVTNKIAEALVVAANSTEPLAWAQGLTIPPGHTLQGLCGTNNNVHVFGSGWLVEGGDR